VWQTAVAWPRCRHRAGQAPEPARRAGAPDARAAAARAGIRRNLVTVFSAHQMGSCQMGTRAKTSVVAPDGQSWQVSGLYLADASVLPTSTGAPPLPATLPPPHCTSVTTHHTRMMMLRSVQAAPSRFSCASLRQGSPPKRRAQRAERAAALAQASTR
jgi:hypothetical protein